MNWSGKGWELRSGDTLRLLLDVPSGSVDAVVTDPPYSSGGLMRSDRELSSAIKYAKGEYEWGEFAGDSRDQRSFGYWCSLWLSECLRVTVDGGLCLVWCDWRQLPTVADSLQAGGWVWRGIIPWVKPRGATRPQLGNFWNRCEYGIVGRKGRGGHDEYCADGVSFELPDILEGVAPRDRVHPTQKPVGVMRDLARLVRPDGLILDCFAGSGTTAVAAMREGRRALLFEIMEENCPIIAERLAAEESGLTLQAARAGQLSILGGEQ